VKKRIGAVMALVLVALLAVSCGVSQDEYDKLNGELTAVKAQIQTLQADLTKKEAELTTALDKMARAKELVDVVNGIFLPAMKGELNDMTELESINYFLSWRDQINAIDDPVLELKFQAIVDSGGTDDSMFAFFVYLFESIPGALE
jgi:outer membrane murein-binding lipoprotein Lpp